MGIQLESPDNPILQKDLEEAADLMASFQELKGKKVFVTGATGLIGSQVIKYLLCLNRIKQMDITVIAYARNEKKAEKVFPYLGNLENLKLVLGDINEPVNYQGEVDYMIHGASATSSRYFVSHPVETIDTAIYGTKQILEFAKKKKVKGFVYLSSLEVYGTPEKDAGLIAEDRYGYIEPLSVRSSYSEGKRMVECLCASYAEEYEVPVKIARLSQTFGAGVEYSDGRVFAEFARSVIEKKDIVLHTEGKTVRSYCYTMDAVTALLTILTKGETAQAYNVTNMDTAISIYDMAEMVCSLRPEAGIRVVKDIPEDAKRFGYNPEMIIRLDSTKLEKLGWKPTVDLKGMFEKLIGSFEADRQ